MDPENIKYLKPVPNIYEYGLKQITAAHIFYKRRGNYAHCLCSECGAEYEIRTTSTGDPFLDDAARIEMPKRDEETKCRSCKIKATYKPAGSFAAEWYEAHIVTGKKISDTEFVFRAFWLNKKIIKNCRMAFRCVEIRRIYLQKGKKPIRFSPSYYDSEKWTQGGSGDTYRYKVHPSTFKEIAKTGMFKYVPRCETVENEYYDDSWVMDYYIAAARYPDMEMIVKLGMKHLAFGLVRKYALNFNPRGKEIHDRLRINKERLKPFIESNGELRLLRFLQYERKTGQHWSNEEYEIAEDIYKHDYDGSSKLITAIKYPSLIKLGNYFRKKGIYYGEEKDYSKAYKARNEYFDYLNIRVKLGYDMTNDIILFPRDIHRRHNEMVLETEKEKIAIREREVLDKYPKIEKNYKKYSDIYSAAAAGYIIRPAKNAAEIVAEGRYLHHCVGGDGYLSKHNTGKSIILFLRKASEKDIPFITIEIRGDRIVQWYGAYDKKPQEEYFQAWLDTYTKELRKHNQKPEKKKKTA